MVLEPRLFKFPSNINEKKTENKNSKEKLTGIGRCLHAQTKNVDAHVFAARITVITVHRRLIEVVRR